MRDYLASLARMRALPQLSVLFGGHGPAIANPYEKIDEYIAHRRQREELILAAVREGASTPKEIVARVYTDVSPKAHAMAERAVLAHLEKLIADGLVPFGVVSWIVRWVIRGNTRNETKTYMAFGCVRTLRSFRLESFQTI